MVEQILYFALFLFGIFSAGHALIHKRDPKSGVGWIIVCIFVPGLGALLYWLGGVNRIQTRAKFWREQGKWTLQKENPEKVEESRPGGPFTDFSHLESQIHVSNRVTRRPLSGGNRIELLNNGEEAYPAMMASIAGAEERVYFSTFIFRTDAMGKTFVQHLNQAAERGVRVLFIIDGLGEWYTFPIVSWLLNKKKVRVSRFLPLALWGSGLHFNLRNHRKLLVVDGQVGFTGGMNIGDHHRLDRPSQTRAVMDTHFKIEGPVVHQLEDAFLEDWSFCTGEREETPPRSGSERGGNAWCRGISAGPNEDFEKLNWIILGALSVARDSVRIMTPYFIPDRSMITALNTAALRGVRVEIILPGRNNLPYMTWAARAFLWEIVIQGVQVFFHPPPFVHTKLFVVDQAYSLVGSANIDPRSLRLNFEFALEIFDRDTAATLNRYFEKALSVSRKVTLEELDGRTLPERLRDSTAKLFSPYL